MNASPSRTWVQEASLLSRTPSAAETVRPDAQMAGKPASSTILADRPSWGSMRNARAGGRKSDLNRVAFEADAPELLAERDGSVVMSLGLFRLICPVLRPGYEPGYT